MSSAEEQTKECSKCGQEKPLSGFHKDKSGRLGVVSWCKVCVSEYKKQYHQKNKDKIAARQKQYRQENRDKELERSKQYYQENRDKMLEYAKQYQQENRDKITEYKKQYYQENREKMSEYYKQYRQENRDKISAYRHENRDKISEGMKQYCQNLPSMIYEIHNTITKQIYVGQTSVYKRRWNSHKSKLRKGTHPNPQLQKAWDKWGEDAFCFDVVEELPCDFNKEQLLEKEAALMLEHISNGVKLYNEDIPK